MSYLTQADLGGQPGHGPRGARARGELFHAAWEPRALALTLAMGATGAWNIDISRAARETLPDYARLSYYEIWIAGLRGLLAERGLAEPDELAAGHALHPAAAAAAPAGCRRRGRLRWPGFAHRAPGRRAGPLRRR